MIRKIYLCTNVENVELLDRAIQNYANLFNGINTDGVAFLTERPMFEAKQNGHYKIYIGKEVEKRKEHSNGLEFPLSVLENEGSFRDVANALISQIEGSRNI